MSQSPDSSTQAGVSRSLRATLLSHLLVGLCIAAFFWKSLAGQGVFFTLDHCAVCMPIYIENAEMRAAGEWPLWNRHSLLGYPAQAEHELNGFYPATIIFNLIDDPGRAYSVFIVLHFFIAAFSMMFLLRRLGAGYAAQCAAGLCYALGGTLVGMQFSLTVMLPFSWAPLVVALVLKAFNSRKAIDVVWAALGLALQAISGHPCAGLYMILVFTALVADQCRGPERWKRLGSAALICVATGVLALALIAPDFFYFISHIADAKRTRGFDTAEAMAESIPPQHFTQLLAPDLIANSNPGYTLSSEERVYFSLIGLPLLLLGWNAPHPNRNLFRWLFVGGLVLSLGRFSGVAQLLMMLPGFSALHAPQRFLMVASLGACPLIGLGIERLMRGELNTPVLARRCTWFFLSICGLFAILAAIGHFFTSDGWVMDWHSRFISLGQTQRECDEVWMTNNEMWMRYYGSLWAIELAAGLALVSAAYFYGLGKYYQGPRATWLATALLTLDLFLCNQPVVNMLAPPDYYNRDTPIARLWRESPELTRVCTPTDYWILTHYPDVECPQLCMSAWIGIDSINFQAAIIPGSLDGLVHLLSNKQLGVFNVKYIMSMREGTPLDMGNEAKWNLTTNPEFLPRVTLRNDVRVIVEPKEAIAFLNTDEFSLEKSVVLAKPPTYLEGDQSTSLPQEGLIENLQYGGTRISLDVWVPQDSVLVLSDLFYSGWTCTSNSRDVEIIRANGLTRGIGLGAGQHHIEFVYWPRSFAWGLWVAGAAWLVVATFLIASLLQYVSRRRPRSSATNEATKLATPETSST